jgi:hypothetical protein
MASGSCSTEASRGQEEGSAERSADMTDVLAAGPVDSVAEAVARMRAIEEALPPDDGLAHFNRMYRRVTEMVEERLQRDFFDDPAFMSRLDVVFANLYFDATRASVASPEQVPRAWGALLERRSDRRVAPIQFAVAGMNAHINRDLPVAVVRTCEEQGTAPTGGGHHADYFRVNLLLAEIERSVRQSFEAGVLLEADSAVPIVGDVVVNWKLLKARSAAWVSAEALWALGRVSPEIAAAYLDSLDGLVGLAGRGLLAPVVPMSGASARVAGPGPSGYAGRSDGSG